MPSDNQTEFPKKHLKRLSEEFVDATSQLDTEEIKKRILECEGHLLSVENALLADEELLKAKEHAKELSMPYKETKNVEQSKIRYCLYVLEGRGISLSRE